MQQIDLKDKSHNKKQRKGNLEIQCNDKDVPLMNTNLVYKAWERIIEKTGVNKRGPYYNRKKYSCGSRTSWWKFQWSSST